MKKSLVLAMAMALGVTASAYAANPFSDVPAGHWAYDSVNKLAAAGVIEGYPDGTYGGDKLMTRYEMAQIVAKAMAKGANVDKLAAEFADELDSLGVRVAALEKKADNVKIYGTIRYEYRDTKGGINKYTDLNNDNNRLRTRLYVNGDINEDWRYTARIQNDQYFNDNAGNETTKLNRAYVKGKIGGVKVTAGRHGDVFAADGNVYDNTMDGIVLSYGKNVKISGYYGKPTEVDVKQCFVEEDEPDMKLHYDKAWGVSVSAKTGNWDLAAGYDRFIDATVEQEDEPLDVLDSSFNNGIWNVGATYTAGDWKLGAVYLHSDMDALDSAVMVTDYDRDGYVLTASYKGSKADKPGSWGVYGKYYNQSFATYTCHTMNGVANSFAGFDGFKGYMGGVNYTFAKNITGMVEYYDLEGRNEDVHARTVYSRLQFAF